MSEWHALRIRPGGPDTRRVAGRIGAKKLGPALYAPATGNVERQPRSLGACPASPEKLSRGSERLLGVLLCSAHLEARLDDIAKFQREL